MKHSISLIVTILACMIFALSSCNDHIAPTPKTFVLVHGSWQAPYAWQFVKTQLEQQGQTVVLVELPGHGSDNTPPATLTLDSYRDKVVSTINGLPGKVILVGHSMAGMVVSVTAEKIPSRLEKVIYIGAYLPANGQTLLDLANTDSTALLGPALIQSADKTLLDIKTENLAPIFIQDGSDAVKKLVVDNYRAEPAIPFVIPAVLTPANFGSVPKYYIHTLLDHVVGLPLQRRMVKGAGILKEYEINSSHCSHLAMPTEVTRLFMEISQL